MLGMWVNVISDTFSIINVQNDIFRNRCPKWRLTHAFHWCVGYTRISQMCGYLFFCVICIIMMWTLCHRWLYATPQKCSHKSKICCRWPKFSKGNSFQVLVFLTVVFGPKGNISLSCDNMLKNVGVDSYSNILRALQQHYICIAERNSFQEKCGPQRLAI